MSTKENNSGDVAVEKVSSENDKPNVDTKLSEPNCKGMKRPAEVSKSTLFLFDNYGFSSKWCNTLTNVAGG